jgi:DNA-binding transcriptional LysR family regulator
MNLERLKIFYVVAQEGSLAKAAKKLHIAQPALSRTIKLFEEELGTQLFDRMSKLGLRLTPQGERVLKFAERILNESVLFEKLIKEQTDELEGDLTIVTTPYLASQWLPHYLLLGFFEKYPQLRVRVIGKLDSIDINQADIAIRTFIPHHPHIIQRHLFSSHYKLWASPDYLEEHGTPQAPEELDHHRLLAFGGNVFNPYGSVSWILNVGASLDKPRIPYLENNSYEGLFNLANAGLGIIEAPEEYVVLRPNNLVKILPNLDAPVVEVYYMYAKHMEKSKKMLAFEEYFNEMKREQEKESL